MTSVAQLPEQQLADDVQSVPASWHSPVDVVQKPRALHRPLQHVAPLVQAVPIGPHPAMQPLVAEHTGVEAGQSELFAVETHDALTLLHESTVHAHPSSHTTGVPATQPVPGDGAAGSHVSTPLQYSPSEQSDA